MQENLAKAEGRIEEARRTQAEFLDLGDLALSELPASLGDLPHLRALSLGVVRLNEAGELERDWSRNPFELAGLAPLAGLQGLQSLNLSSTGVTDLSPLAGLQGLQSLNLSSTGVTDLAPLAGLQGLQSLNLSSTGVTDLSPLAGLQGLQSLNLSSTDVTDLAPLAGLQGLQSLNLQSTGVTDLAPLAGLQGLQILNLQYCRAVTDLAPLAGLQGLQSLDLASTAVTDLAPLAGLQGLQSLDLASTAVTDLAPLAGLQGLQSLDLTGTAVTGLTPLADLQELQRLDLQYCRGVTDLVPLVGLRRLQSLNLFGCEGLKDLAPLAGLVGLQCLHFGGTGATDLGPLAGLHGLQSLSCGWAGSEFRVGVNRRLALVGMGVTDLVPLAGLQGLQRLNLQDCKNLKDLTPLAGLQGLQNLDLARADVTDLAPLAGLQELQRLNLQNCKSLTNLAPLAGLQGLQNLDLARTDVTDLAPLAGLQGLQTLDLWSTGVTDLTPLAGLQGLQYLNLRYCQGVIDLAPLAKLQGLHELYLYGCRPTVPASLQAFAHHPRLTKLVADDAVGVPREVLSHNDYNNCLPRLRTYFSELDLGTEVENEVKVILLGNGRVGKTQLCRRFRGQPFDETIPSTHGVQIWREELRLQTGGEEKTFQVNWWDFGGQDIYHGTHALFLRSRAVFLILWTPQLENREEYSENEIPLRNHPLAYWLDYVRTLAGEGSPVIVVQSQCDRFADRRPDPARPDSVGFFECCPYSAKEDLGRETLEAHLRDAMRYLLERNGALEIGRGRAEVRRQLYDWRGEDQNRKPEERRYRTLIPEEFRTLCDETGGIVSWEHALDYFHHTGVVFYDSNLFSDRIVLDQTWALDAVYTVFHRGRAAPWLRDSGRFTREDLALMVWQDHSPEEQKLFLGLMESCGVCFPCGKTAQGEARYVAPDLLPRFKAVADRLHAWKEEPGRPTFRLEYRFFHPAVIRSLMSEIGRRAGDLAEYWKYGLWLKDGQRDTQLLVQFEDISTDEAPGSGALELKAQGRDPLGLLREIRKAILERRIGEKPEELLTLNGSTVARSAFNSAVDDGRVLDLRRKLVPGAAFAAFFEGREHEPAEGRAIDIKPIPLSASEKPRKVFISYAWGDETSEGRTRKQVCDALDTALVEDGFHPVRDRDQMRPGDQISAFIRSLTRADFVVAVISDKYLCSPYCMTEIHGLWQRSQEDANLMAERLVPIILPDVQIGGPRDRAHYVRYWKKQKEELEELFRELGPDLDPETLRELRLIRHFAQDSDGILRFLQDILIPRKLEVHFDDGFQAVREALRRRMGVGE